MSENKIETREFGSCFEVINALKGFWHNKNLRYVCFIILFYRLGFSTIENGYLKLLRAGFPKEIWSEIGMFFFPLSVIIPLVYGRLAGGKKIDFTYFMNTTFIKTLAAIPLVICIE